MCNNELVANLVIAWENFENRSAFDEFTGKSGT